MKYALSIILFVGLFASPLYAYLIYLDRHLEVVGLTVAPDTDFLGRDVMAFSGEIRNTHDVYGIQLIEVYVVLKKEGKIIERSWVYDDDDGMVPDSEGYDTLLPGATTSFRVWTLHLLDEYDEYYVRAQGIVAKPHREEVWEIDYQEFDFGQIENWNPRTGFEYDILDHASVGCYDSDYSSYCLGELVNKTNADFVTGAIVLKLFDAEGEHIGWAGGSYKLWPTLSAYGRLDFRGDIQWRFPGRDYAAPDIVGWELDPEYTGFQPYRLVEPAEAVPTVIETQTWGTIKDMHR